MSCECEGTGEIQVPTWIGSRQGPPEIHPCPCTRAPAGQMQAKRLDDFWPGLSRVVPAQSSNLAGRSRDNAVIACAVEELRAHMARLVLDDDHLRRTAVVLTDDDLVCLQFSGPGGEAAVEEATVDPELLVLRLGVRMSKNDLLAGIILTALATRRGADMPTWLVVDPDRKIKKGLPCYHEQLAATMQRWPQVKPALADEAPAKKADRDAAGLREAVQKAGGRLLRADAMKLLVLSDRSLSRVTAAAGLRTQQIPAGSNVVFITT